MSNVQLDPTVHVTFGFERKQNMGDFNSATASAYASVDVPSGASVNEYSEALANAAAAVKAAVYEELGIEVYADDNGVLREAKTPLSSINKVEEVVGRQFAGTQDVSSGNGVRIVNAKKTDGAPIPQDVLNKMIADGTTEVWDQRATATGKQPVYKETKESAEKNGRQPKGYWLN